MAREQSPDILRHLCPLDCGWHHDEPATTVRPPEPVDETVWATAAAVTAIAGRTRRRIDGILREHAATHDPGEWLAALSEARDVPAEARTSAADWLRREAAAMDRLCELLAWPVLSSPPRIDAATLRAVAQLLENKETE